MIWSLKAASFGAISLSIACTSPSLMVPVWTPYTAVTRSRVSPVRSIAAMVLSKVGAAGFLAMPSISARFSAIAASSAGPRSLTLNRPNGGTPPHGPVQGASSTLCVFCGWLMLVFSVCSFFCGAAQE